VQKPRTKDTASTHS